MPGDFGNMQSPQWRFFTDAVMGGISTGQVEFGEDGPRRLARLTGRVSTANGGGFIQIQHRLGGQLPEVVAAVQLTCRGNGERYFVHLRSSAHTAPTAYWRAAFDTTQDWQQVHLPLAAFTPSRPGLPSTIGAGLISAVAVVAYGRDHIVDVSIGEIGFH